MDILFIQPRKPNFNTKADKHWVLTRPMSLFFLAASIEKYTDFNVDVLDFERHIEEDINIEYFIKINKANVYGITATSYSRFEAIKIAKIIKKIHPKSYVFVGGPHFMYCGKDTLENVEEIDIVARGEGEITVVELCNAINEGKDLKDIKGITYRKNGCIIENEDQNTFEDLDSIPIYSKFNWDNYPEYLMGYPQEKIKAISIMASRGCTGRCIFCSKSGMKYRLRDPQKVVDEIEYYKNKFRIEAVNFLDLTFTASHRHVRNLCQEMINRKLNIKWWCESRVNIPLDLLDIMKEAGCVSLVVGVESGSDKIIKTVGKDITIKEVKKFCQKCHDIGIIVTTYFMFSLPNETKEDVEKTIDLIKELRKYGVNSSFQPTTIYPGTQLEKIAQERGILKDDFSWCEHYDNNLNKKLGQLCNVPLYNENFDEYILKKFINKKEKNDEQIGVLNNIERELELKIIYREYYNLTNKWLKNRNRNINIYDLLLERDIRKIAIYGTGEIGKRLYEELFDTKIIVEYFIDSKLSKINKNIDGITVIGINEISLNEDVDSIIVTPFYDFDEIQNSLVANGYNGKILSIEEVIDV